MMVRLKQITKTACNEYRLTLDLVDHDRTPWELGDCALRVDLLDAPGRHWSSPRGLLKPACDLYRLAPDDPPVSSESRLLWEVGQAVDRYIDRVFRAGILCPAMEEPAERPRDDAPDRSDGPRE